MSDDLLAPDPLWYKDAIIYELHVKTFQDSTGDGMGDFRGLIGKLDYLQDLGVTAIWLLPFYPSPLRDDGYDIANYYDVNPNYGTLADFQAFLAAAHERGLRVITELVINHTSDQNPWFQKSRRAMAARNAVEPGALTAAGQSQRRPGSTPSATKRTMTLMRTSMSGVIRQRNTRTRESSSRISRLRTGRGIRWRRPITGTGFILTNRI